MPPLKLAPMTIIKCTNRLLGKYKFLWMGCSKGIHGVGLFVADRWIENVLEVKLGSERLMVVRVIVGRTVLNLISAYVSQAGRNMREKEEIFTFFQFHTTSQFP